MSQIPSLEGAELLEGLSTVHINSTFEINKRCTLCGRISGDSRRKKFLSFRLYIHTLGGSQPPRFAGSVYFLPMPLKMGAVMLRCSEVSFYIFLFSRQSMPNGIYGILQDNSLIIWVCMYTPRHSLQNNSDQLRETPTSEHATIANG